MRVIYYFDTISPYSLFAWKFLRQHQKLWGMDLILKPVLLGGIMKATGNVPPGSLPSRAKFMSKDLKRSSLHYQQPLLRIPSNFFTEVVGASVGFQRLICAAQESGMDREQVEVCIYIDLSIFIHTYCNVKQNLTCL